MTFSRRLARPGASRYLIARATPAAGRGPPGHDPRAEPRRPATADPGPPAPRRRFRPRGRRVYELFYSRTKKICSFYACGPSPLLLHRCCPCSATSRPVAPAHRPGPPRGHPHHPTLCLLTHPFASYPLLICAARPSGALRVGSSSSSTPSLTSQRAPPPVSAHASCPHPDRNARHGAARLQRSPLRAPLRSPYPWWASW